MTLKKLHGTLTTPRCLQTGEGSEISPFPGFWVLLTRVQPIFARSELPNHLTFPTLLHDGWLACPAELPDAAFSILLEALIGL